MANNSAPNVGRLPTFVTESKRSLPTRVQRDVDAILRHEFFVARKVNGRHGVFRPVAAPAPRRTENAEWPRQKMPRSTDAPGADQFANLAAGHGFAAHGHLGINLDLKSHLAAQIRRACSCRPPPCGQNEN